MEPRGSTRLWTNLASADKKRRQTMSDNHDPDNERGEYEAGRLVRDVATNAVTTSLVAGLVNPLAGAVTAITMGVKQILDKAKRDREWNGEE